MKLKRFTATNIHGFLKFDIKFFDDLSLLTGINGSGKTSALNAIVALLTPDLASLANLEFTKLRLDVINNESKLSISASKEDERITLSVSSSSDPLSFNVYTPDGELPFSRQVEAEGEHYREVVTFFKDHQVLKTITSLPTPMFLGLDRRARFDEEVRRSRAFARPRKSTRSVFGTSLARSLEDAAELAETRFRDTLIESGGISEKLQNEMLLSLLNVKTDGAQRLSLPTQEKKKEIQDLKSNLDPLAKILRLPSKEVKTRVEPFLDMLLEAADKLPPKTSIKDIIEGTDADSEKMDNLFLWSTNQTHLKRINVISDIVQKYNNFRSELNAPVENYLKLIDKFLQDGGKTVKFNDYGYIYVDVKGVKGEKPITSLSSGEAQIFVILTHLAFNRNAQKNVFIIDEPELSLHVQWQELFVDSLREANPQIQYIMATHSPSVILDRIDRCIDISRKI